MVTTHTQWTNLPLSIHVKSCKICQQLKNPPGKPVGFLQSTITSEPGEMLGVDLMGPLPSSKAQKTVLMVVVDYFSKWVELFALQDAKVPKICSTLKDEIFTRWGVPKYIVSDRGPQFTSSMLQELYIVWGIKQKLTTAYHPQTNLTERVNRTLKTMVASYVGERHQDWDRWLPELRFPINTAVHEATGQTPARVAIGRQLKSPLDRLITPAPLPDSKTYNTIQILEKLKQQVQRRLVSATSRQAKYYNARRRAVPFAVGDLVWTRTHPISSAVNRFAAKLAPKWGGPLRIIKRLGPVNFRVQRGSGVDAIVETIHVANIKPYFGPAVPPTGGGDLCSAAT
uniref:Integrase catalytic domain-containing protein n=1 Tax=Erpetoichthys calabaricus TaxID=27687 RepID=A0A8C4S3F8_ERPCA